MTLCPLWVCVVHCQCTFRGWRMIDSIIIMYPLCVCVVHCHALFCYNYTKFASAT